MDVRQQIQSCSVQCKIKVMADWLFGKGGQHWLVSVGAEFRAALKADSIGPRLHRICHNPSWSPPINRFTFRSGLDSNSDSIGSHKVCHNISVLNLKADFFGLVMWHLCGNLMSEIFDLNLGGRNEGKKNVILPNMVVCVGWKNAIIYCVKWWELDGCNCIAAAWMHSMQSTLDGAGCFSGFLGQ